MMHKRGYNSLVWGGLLIALGLVLLVENLGLLGDWNAPVGSLILGAISLVFLATFASDRRQWWALIPGLVILGIAVAVFFTEQNLVAEYVVASIILAGVGLPFLLIFIAYREHWWALIPGMTMSGIAAAVFFEGAGLISGTAVGGLIVGGVSLSFLSIYVMDRKQRWALFPGGVLGTVAVFLLIATVAEIAWPVALILFGLLLLRGNLGGRRRRSRRPAPAKPVSPKRERLPTLEEQIEAAVVEESVEEAKLVGEPEPPLDVPPAPEMPEPPDVPPPDVG